MAEKKEITVKLVSQAGQLHYDHVDACRACHTGDDFAVAFFQLDYLDFATQTQNHRENPSSEIPEINAIAMSRVVMSRKTYIATLKNMLQVAYSAGISTEKILEATPGVSKGDNDV